MDAYSWFKRNLSRPKAAPSSSINNNDTSKLVDEEESQLYGITGQLIEFVKSLTIDTFKNFSLPDEEEEGGSNGDGASGNMRRDLSEWQQRHAMLLLSKVKELSQLRFRLCPRFLKERQFWRIYFTLVRSYVAEYELHAIRLAKLKEMRLENGSNGTQTDISACEVEMSEAKQITSVVPAASFQEFR